MGRKPTKNLNLPPRMRARKRGTVTYYFYDHGGKPRKETSLGTNFAQAVIKWGELEGGNHNISNVMTLKTLAAQYLKDVLPSKAARTQTDNLLQLDRLIEFFGSDAPIDEIHAVHVRQYLDYRKDSPVSANRDKALFSHMFNKAREWGMTNAANPCTGIKSFTENGRTIYVEDNVVSVVYASACQPIKDAIDLAYLTAQRVSDTVAMSEADISNGKLAVFQGKTSKKLRIDIVGELDALIKRIIARKVGYKVRTLQLICNEKGRALTINRLQIRFREAKARAVKANPHMKAEIEAFQFRDLRAKAATDKHEDTRDITAAQKLLGHTTVGMTEEYLRDRRGESVKPTK
ncbi:MAG: tyrosine-type recombinase/integrase [Methylobacillus glycogenes]|nr:tyrosine-type recombinase/integrase [Methylobacillus glycogenes]